MSEIIMDRSALYDDNINNLLWLQANCENCTEEKPEVENPNKQLEIDSLKRDSKKLRMQIKEVNIK